MASDDNVVALPQGKYGWARFPERIETTPVLVPGSRESVFTRRPSWPAG